jgi:pyridoxal phosphate enzyme (YggS family)
VAASIAQQVAQAYQQVTNRISRAAQRCGRDPGTIQLVAVTKYATPPQIQALYDAGHRDMAENRAQQLVARTAAFPADFRWHMIGHLQRNKVKIVQPWIVMLHSVDSLRLAQAVDDQAMTTQTPIDVLLQVNVSGEVSKFGVSAEEAIPLAGQLSAMTYLRLRGLMTMAPYSDDPEDARPTFRACRQLYEHLGKALATEAGAAAFDTLSMGMTGDFEVAIEEGATLVRIGSALFGESA